MAQRRTVTVEGLCVECGEYRCFDYNPDLKDYFCEECGTPWEE